MAKFYHQQQFTHEIIIGIYFFQEGTVTNSAIRLVLYAIQIFLSLPTGRITLIRRFFSFCHVSAKAFFGTAFCKTSKLKCTSLKACFKFW